MWEVWSQYPRSIAEGKGLEAGGFRRLLQESRSTDEILNKDSGVKMEWKGKIRFLKKDALDFFSF